MLLPLAVGEARCAVVEGYELTKNALVSVAGAVVQKNCRDISPNTYGLNGQNEKRHPKLIQRKVTGKIHRVGKLVAHCLLLSSKKALHGIS